MSRDTDVNIFILTAVQNGYQSRGKVCCILIKNVLFKHYFQDEGHLNASFLNFALTIYRKCLLYHFFNSGIRMHILILIRVQNGRRSP